MGKNLVVEIGIFARTYHKNNFREVFAAIKKDGISKIHFDFSTMGLDSMPVNIEEDVVSNLKKSLKENELEIVSLSATFNIIHPDLSVRKNYFKRFNALAKCAKEIETSILTLCTGTKDMFDKWKFHPDNDKIETWKEFIESMSELLSIAEKYDLRLGIESEINNVVSSPAKAFKAIQELNNPRVGIIMDGANLFHLDEIDNMEAVLHQAFKLLCPYILLAHAKDLKKTDPIEYCAAGKGVLNFPLFVQLLKKSHYQGPIILHGLNESEVKESKEFLESII